MQDQADPSLAAVMPDRTQSVVKVRSSRTLVIYAQDARIVVGATWNMKSYEKLVTFAAASGIREHGEVDPRIPGRGKNLRTH